MFLTISKLVAIDAVTISGSILDMLGNPLAGSNVLLINTLYGGAADTEGLYSITVPANLISDNNANIRASFIGYRSITDSVSFFGKKNIVIKNCKISNFISGPNNNILEGTEQIIAIGKIVNNDFLNQLL